jgi:hypothetical protein
MKKKLNIYIYIYILGFACPLMGQKTLIEMKGSSTLVSNIHPCIGGFPVHNHALTKVGFYWSKGVVEAFQDW